MKRKYTFNLLQAETDVWLFVVKKMLLMEVPMEVMEDVVVM
jgi:hypothetical protein